MTVGEQNKADLSCYVAIGDSITAGYTDGALFREGQEHSFAALLAGQFRLRNGGSFRQALLPPGSSGIGFWGNSRIILDEREQPAYALPHGDDSVFASNSFVAEGPFHNISVPGAKVISVPVSGYGNPANGFGNYNPFFARMASDPVGASMLGDALALRPTFYSLFIGNNDVLTYALSGGTMDAVTPPAGGAGTGFEGSVHEIISAMAAQGAKGVVASLPDISFIPFFTRIPYNGLFLKIAEASALNKKYMASRLMFSQGYNPFPLRCGSSIRPARAGEFILADLLLDPERDSYLSGALPVPQRYFLSLECAAEVQAAVKSYNLVIRQAAEQYGLAFVDLHAILRSRNDEGGYDPVRRRATLSKRGIFSLDGLHINLRGHALLTNEFVKAINERYGADIPALSFSRYRALLEKSGSMIKRNNFASGEIG